MAHKCEQVKEIAELSVQLPLILDELKEHVSRLEKQNEKLDRMLEIITEMQIESWKREYRLKAVELKIDGYESKFWLMVSWVVVWIWNLIYVFLEKIMTHFIK